MAKDPAFLFYPNDWLGGTLGMTFEEKGAYMELLMLQFNRGHMTSHMMGHMVGQNLDKLLHKFTKDENGLYYNVRLDEEKEKRKTFTASRRNNITGTNQHTKNNHKKEGHKGGHMSSHMENENNNTIISNKEDKIEKSKQLWNYLLNSKKWIEPLIMKHETNRTLIALSLKDFFAIQNLIENPREDAEEVKKHFGNWLKTNPPKKVAALLSNNPAPWANFGKDLEV